MRRAASWVIASCVGVAASGADLRAESDLTAAVQRQFELGAEPSPKALHEVQAHYKQLPEPVRDDPLVRYAHAVVLVRQKRMFDARPLLDKASAARPHDLAVWQASVWVHLTLGDRSQALAELERFDHALLGPTSSIRGEELREAAEFCGKLFGFLSGPWHSRLHAADLEKLKSKLRGAFGPDDQAAFDEAEREVAAKFDELRGKHKSLSQQTHDEARKRFAQARTDLQKSQTSLDEKKQVLSDKDAKRNEEVKAKLAEIDGKLEKLEQQYENIAAQMAPLELQREALMAQMAAIAAGDVAINQSRIKRGFMPRIGILPYYNAAELALAPIVAQLNVLAGEAAEVIDGVTELEAERQTLVFGRVQDAGKISVKKREIEKQQVRLDHSSKRLKAPKNANTVQSRASAAKLTLLSTYLDFPFEREKERILSSLAAE